MLEEATRRWMIFRKKWEEYCTAQRMEHIVMPVFVIQVEDGTEQKLTCTNLNKIVEVVERHTGVLPERAWVHAFQEDKIIEANGQTIRKIKASKIQDDPEVRIVLFKISLSTGWDCPRAEVMISFRKAIDHTLIAQLVGRMVRNPLARTIEGQEFLNTVVLCLPHYDSDGLEAIINKLQYADPETGIGVETEKGNQLVQLNRDPAKAHLFSKLKELPTYRVDRIRSALNIARLIKLARQLASFDELDVNALDEVKKLILNILSNELVRLRSNPSFVGNVSDGEEIEIQEVQVEYGVWRILETPQPLRIRITPENIEDLFVQCGRRLGNEGVHMEFWKAQKDKENHLKVKLELFAILQDEKAWQKLEQACSELIQILFRKHYDSIRRLPSSRQERYWRIKGMAKEPESVPLTMPMSFMIKEYENKLARHLFIDEHNSFGTKLNTWETQVLNEEFSNPEVVGWLRNFDRKSWSICVPYKMNSENKPLYPDFIVFRSLNGEPVVDILDPHRTDLPDAVPKVKGLAEYARKHGEQFGRIEYIIVNPNGETKRLDLNNQPIRERVLKVESKSHLDQLLEDWG